MSTPRKEPEESPTQFTRAVRELLPYTQLGWQMVSTLLLALGAGYLLDRWLGTTPTLLVVSMVLGIVVAIIQFVHMAQQLTAGPPRTSKRTHTRT
jgi:F0F1-type ATP synthase assembly protein I